jgi:hypothetical protein
LFVGDTLLNCLCDVAAEAAFIELQLSLGGECCAISITNSPLMALQGALSEALDDEVKEELKTKIAALKEIVHLLVSASYPPASETGTFTAPSYAHFDKLARYLCSSAYKFPRSPTAF